MVALVSNYFIGRSRIGIKLYDSVILHNKSVSNIIHSNMVSSTFRQIVLCFAAHCEFCNVLHFQSEWRIFAVGGGAFLGCMHLRVVLDLVRGDLRLTNPKH